MSVVRWVRGETNGPCAVCGDESVKERLLEATIGQALGAIVASRCMACASIVIEGELVEDTTPNDRAVDWYVEQFAGVGVIFDRLAAFADAGIRRFADVGCNFGFGVDIAARLFGWDAEGFDPSHGARRGSQELTPRIRPEILDADTLLRGEPFDLVLASEVIEHVADPAAFLAGVVAHMQPDALLVLTTPSARAVATSTSSAVLLAALSPGHHRFLASKAALTTMLMQAGFIEIDVQDDGETLVAIATRSTQQARVVDRGGDGLIRYLDLLADADDVSDLVRVGAAARHFKDLVLRGHLDDAARSRDRLVRLMLPRYGLSLDDLAEIEDRCAHDEPLPSFISSTLFADGVLALNTGRADSAAKCFGNAVRSWMCLERASAGGLDGETAHLGLMSAGHLLVALAGSAPEEISAALRQVDDVAPRASERERSTLQRLVATAFTGAVSAGAFTSAEELQPRVDASLDRLLTGDPSDRRAGLDALFCSAMMSLQRSRPLDARERFLRCCAETGRDNSEHATGLFRAAEQHLGMVVEQLEVLSARGGIVHDLDLYWADASGIYVQGFAFVPGLPAQAIGITWGRARVDDAGPSVHAGASAMYPSDPASTMSGFRAQLLGPLTDRLTIEVVTIDGVRRVELELPSHPLPDWPDEPDLEISRRAMLEMIARRAPPGRVVALGTRGMNDHGTLTIRNAFPDRDVLSVDIHPGPGVDLVGDAHTLATLLEPGSVAAFISDDVFEHLEVPWLAAAEAQRILMIDGLVLISVPTIWPEHAAPNDFWRFSVEGLRSLFGPALGFEVINAGGFGTVSVLPGPSMRELHMLMPVLHGPSSAYVVARKTRELGIGEVQWPYDGVGGPARAQRYPIDGVQTGR
jgi:SAM-dependent methyltransferase